MSQALLEAKTNLHQVLAAKAYRARTNKLLHYKPYAKQLEFHEKGAEFRERLFSAGNQLGKTVAGSMESAMHLTGRYPSWWRGRVFDRPTVGYVASETSELTRDGAQRLLFGRAGVTTEFGTGAIPLDAIVATSPRPGTPNAISQAVIRHGGGGDVQAKESTLIFRSYDQGREKFQADTVDFFWFDEEPPLDVYSEGITRTNKVMGPVFVTFTPLKGMSQTVLRFMSQPPWPNTTVVFMGIYDAGHYTKAQADQIVATYPHHEREARAYGKPVLGSGAVYPIVESAISVTPFEIPGHWARICGLDLGWDHPTAGVWIAHDRDTGTKYVYDVYRQSAQPPSVHAAAINARGKQIPVAWPHDALQKQKDTGKPLRDAYKKLGVNMLPERAQFEDGSIGVEPGIQIIFDEMVQGRFKVFSSCADWFQEYRMYHRKDGEIVKLMDDLMDGTRYARMSIRFARPFNVVPLQIYRSASGM